MEMKYFKRNSRLILLFSLILLITVTFTGCLHEHDWTNATCYNPVTCVDCGETAGEPRGHVWSEATCEEPKFCTDCGKTEGTALGHDFGFDNTCSYCGIKQALPLPQSGQVFIGSDLYCESQLTIVSSTTESCYIKLKGTSGTDVFSFFVRAGDSVTVDVPAGYYYVYFSYGTDWYGTDELFGPNTTYAKDDEICDFENYIFEYTLEPTYSGNFSATTVNEDEFK